MNEITIGAARIPYRVLGDGRPLVLVHGTSASSRNWDQVAEEFAETRRVVLPNLSGSDLASDDGGPLTIELLADQVAAIIAEVAGEPADVVGHSMGAPVVAALAATRPELVRNLVLTAGFPGPADEHLRNALIVWRHLAGHPATFARYAMLLGFSREHLDSIGREAVEELASVYLPNANRLRQFDLDLRLDVRALLPQIQAPTLVIGCTRDSLVSLADSRELAAAIPDAAYAELESGHMVMAERPDEFVKLVRDFSQSGTKR